MSATAGTEGGAPASRLERFRRIIEAAAGSAHADYGGYGKFWNLPLPELRQMELYGIAMMRASGGTGPAAAPTAPAATAPCCHHPAPAPRQASAAVSGEAGLIRGLRGQFPFDGTQFPPLPWGGARVAEPDIQLIEGWIAAGCPSPEEDSAPAGTVAAEATRHALSAGLAPHPEFTGSVNQLAHETGTLKARKNVVCLPDDELRRLRGAIREMRKLDDYPLDQRSFAYWAQIHANQCQHGWEEFLSWHRAYLYGFEKALQDIDPSVTLPYWDWAADVQNVKISIGDMGVGVTNPYDARDNGWVPEPFQCWIDEDGLKTLKDGGHVTQDTLTALQGKLGTKYCSGARLFADANIQFGVDPTSDKAIIAVLADINPLWHWRRWPGGNKDLIFEAYPTQDDVERILNIGDFFKFGSGPMSDQFFGALETIHNLIHNYSGGHCPPTWPIGQNNEFLTGDMVDPGRTARDPIFWAHHANVDRLWAEWQKRFPGAGPDDPSANLPPWSYDVSDMASTRNLGYEYMLASHVFQTNAHTPIQLFHSAPARVHPEVLVRHRRAEVRLHAIRYAMRPGYCIRVFLNQPDASIQTPTRGNPHYVGQISTFMGECVGGPGHCDAPVRSQDRFDLRPRPQKTPTNFVLDATAAVKALTVGESNIHVNLLVLNHDGSPATDAFHLGAVSLNFFD
jgi:tyrosinase